MSSNKLTIPPEFLSASKEQQVDFVQNLWNQIAQNPENVPVTEQHKKILSKRLEDYRSSPREGKAWSEVREQLLDQFGKA